MEKLHNYLPVPKGAMILGENQYYSQNCYETKLNNNVLVVGASGAGKTRYVVKPNLLQACGSYVVSDPKGNLCREMGPYLKSKGYNVVKIDFIHPENLSNTIRLPIVKQPTIYANWHIRWYMKCPALKMYGQQKTHSGMKQQKFCYVQS